MVILLIFKTTFLTFIHIMKYLVTIALFAALFSYKASAQATIAAKDASRHIGKIVTICEKVSWEIVPLIR